MTFRPVGGELQHLLDEWLENPAARRAVMQRAWERAVGERVSRRCRPIAFEAGVLTVEVSDAAWAPELRAMSREFIRKVNETIGQTSVRRIEWRLGEGAAAADS